MQILKLKAQYLKFKANSLKNRFFKHSDVVALIKKLPTSFEVTTVGKSENGKNINLIKWGRGNTKIFLWSQMHGNEPTGTMALFDLFNFLQSNTKLVQQLNQTCQLYIIPMVNPDGAEKFTRTNAFQIDINRDFLQQASAEAKILKKCSAEINPNFGFNLHDQNTLWSVSKTLKPATLSFLAPAIDDKLSLNTARKNAMLVIACIFKALKSSLPGKIGLFNDEFEPRAFGDNFQGLGIATILFEAGGYKNDAEKQEVRKYTFLALLAGLNTIATEQYLQQEVKNYLKIPKNNKQIFHILLKNATINGLKTSLGINYEERPNTNALGTTKIYSITDLGDLSFNNAYQIYNANKQRIEGNIILNKTANFKLIKGNQIILSFQNGKLI